MNRETHLSRKRMVKLERLKLFVRAYMVDFNGKASAIQVGIAPGSAAKQAIIWLRDPDCQELFKKYMAELQEQSAVKVEKVIGELSLVGFSSVEHYTKKDGNGQLYIDFTDATPDDMKAIKKVKTRERVLMTTGGSEEGEPVSRLVERTTEIELWDKVGSLDKLLRYFGGYVGKEAPGIQNNGGTVNLLQQNNVSITPQEAADEYRKMLDSRDG